MAIIACDAHDCAADCVSARVGCCSAVCSTHLRGRRLHLSEIRYDILVTQRGWMAPDTWEETKLGTHELPEDADPVSIYYSLMSLRPVPGALELFNGLTSLGHQVPVVTASDRPALRKLHLWMPFHGFPIGTPIHSCGRKGSKVEIVHDLLDADVVIDNKTDVLIPIPATTKSGKHRYRFLLSRPNNLKEQPERNGIVRVPDMLTLYSWIMQLFPSPRQSGMWPRPIPLPPLPRSLARVARAQALKLSA